MTSSTSPLLIPRGEDPEFSFLSVLLLRAASFPRDIRRKGLIPVARPTTQPIRFATIAISILRLPGP